MEGKGRWSARMVSLLSAGLISRQSPAKSSTRSQCQGGQACPYRGDLLPISPGVDSAREARWPAAVSGLRGALRARVVRARALRALYRRISPKSILTRNVRFARKMSHRANPRRVSWRQKCGGTAASPRSRSSWTGRRGWRRCWPCDRHAQACTDARKLRTPLSFPSVEIDICPV